VPRIEGDTLTHLYTLILNAKDQSYEVQIDGVKKESGKLAEDWDFLLPKEIDDPTDKKPSDWVDEPEMDDPDAKKPDDWDAEPETVADPDAKMPEDWDDEEDGAWEAPTIPNPKFKGAWKAKKIPNPAYKGLWKAKQIANPEYKGEWVHPLIPNPDYVEDKELHHRCNGCTHIGFELWQVKAGTIFDDILVTDSLEEAKEYADKTFNKKKGPEKEAFEAAEEARREKDREEREKADAEHKHDDEEEDHDEL